ncbi:hypothetical protein Q3A86_33150 [Streptomyces sp. NBUA17]|uniref:hypothetical protein n=1 Tax=Streptomyces sp. NBUA17 TaxID=3062275 RepID=UPI0037DA743D
MSDPHLSAEAVERAPAPSAADVRDWLARHLPAAGLTLTDWQSEFVLRHFGSRARL